MTCLRFPHSIGSLHLPYSKLKYFWIGTFQYLNVCYFKCWLLSQMNTKGLPHITAAKVKLSQENFTTVQCLNVSFWPLFWSKAVTNKLPIKVHILKAYILKKDYFISNAILSLKKFIFFIAATVFYTEKEEEERGWREKNGVTI